jgi:MYXO-CTERM domain-containing protein
MATGTGTAKEMAMRMRMMLCVVLMAMVAAPVQATGVWGFDNTTEFLINPATVNPGGYTSYANIDAAVAAGVAATRTVMEFEGDWSAVSINETIDLRNDGLTFQGASGGTSMTWSGSYTGAAFGDQNQANMTATIKDLTITTQGSGSRGVTWAATTWNTGVDATLAVSNCTFDTVGDTIYMRSETTGGDGMNVDVDCVVEDSVLRSSAGNGIYTRVGKASGLVEVYDSRIEAYGHGVVASYVWAGGMGVTIDASEIVSSNPSPSAGDTGVYCAGFAPSRPLLVVDSLVAGFDMGIDGGNPTFVDNLYRSVLLANNTIIGTGTSTGIEVGLQPGNHNYDDISGILVNNIIAGHNVGLFANRSEPDAGASVTVQGDNNAFFANTSDTVANGASISDSGRLTPAGYTLANTFLNPSADQYRLLAAAIALFDAGEQFTTASLGGTSTFLDINNSGSTYEDGTDYVIDLGGGTATGSTKLALVDADYDAPAARLLDGTVDIGAYEGSVTLPVAESAGLGLIGLALLGLKRRRS